MRALRVLHLLQQRQDRAAARSALPMPGCYVEAVTVQVVLVELGQTQSQGGRRGEGTLPKGSLPCLSRQSQFSAHNFLDSRGVGPSIYTPSSPLVPRFPHACITW